MMPQEFGNEVGRDTGFFQLAVFIQARGKQSYLDRVEVHVLGVDVFEAVPFVGLMQFPAFDVINVFRLPYVEIP